MGDKGYTVKHLTGAELQAIERHTGHLPRVANDDTGALVRVPNEYLSAVEGAEEISGNAVAATTYNRGIGHAEQADEALKQADEASREDDRSDESDDDSA